MKSDCSVLVVSSCLLMDMVIARIKDYIPDYDDEESSPNLIPECDNIRAAFASHPLRDACQGLMNKFIDDLYDKVMEEEHARSRMSHKTLSRQSKSVSLVNSQKTKKT